MTTHPTQEAEDFLEDLANELEVPESRYEAAERSYTSLGEWLNRDASSVRIYDPDVYVQGSFRLGTTIRPFTSAEEYDVDSVCELRLVGKQHLSQATLKEMLRIEIQSYHDAQSMEKPVREGRRCWILDYADGAQFHMDIVPALPNATAQRLLLESRGLDAKWTATAIGITDRETWNYQIVHDDWPRSNPRGYSEWFKSRMADIFRRRRQRMAESIHASIEKIPEYRVRTPLQAAIMILKRHRDWTFAGNHEARPISVIITTLAAHAYNGEETVAQALVSILAGMDRYIGVVDGQYWIANPTDPLENFADKWAQHPERAHAFFAWLEKARQEFSAAADKLNRKVIADSVAAGIGQELAERAMNRRPPNTRLRAASAAPTAASGFSFPDKPRVPTKPRGFA